MRVIIVFMREGWAGFWHGSSEVLLPVVEIVLLRDEVGPYARGDSPAPRDDKFEILVPQTIYLAAWLPIYTAGMTKGVNQAFHEVQSRRNAPSLIRIASEGRMGLSGLAAWNNGLFTNSGASKRAPSVPPPPTPRQVS